MSTTRLVQLVFTLIIFGLVIIATGCGNKAEVVCEDTFRPHSSQNTADAHIHDVMHNVWRIETGHPFYKDCVVLSNLKYHMEYTPEVYNVRDARKRANHLIDSTSANILRLQTALGDAILNSSLTGPTYYYEPPDTSYSEL